MERNKEQKWVKPPTNNAATIFTPLARRRRRYRVLTPNQIGAMSPKSNIVHENTERGRMEIDGREGDIHREQKRCAVTYGMAQTLELPRLPYLASSILRVLATNILQPLPVKLAGDYFVVDGTLQHDQYLEAR